MPVLSTIRAHLSSCIPCVHADDTQPTVVVTVTQTEKTGLFHAHGFDPKTVMDQLSNPKRYGATMTPMSTPEKKKLESNESDAQSTAPTSEKSAKEGSSDSGNEDETQSMP